MCLFTHLHNYEKVVTIMSDDLFPFGLSSHVALVTLIQKSNPQLRLDPAFCEFGDMYGSPTEAEPGRTFIEMTDHLNQVKGYFVYRRVPIDRVILCKNPIKVKTPLTPTTIIEEINRARRLALGPIDVPFSTLPTGTEDGVFDFKLEALPTSYLYIGSVVIPIQPIVIGGGHMRTETSALMIQEDGTFMMLETP